MKEENVINFYVMCNKLKDVVRTGWKDWGIKRFRIESVAEHIYGVQMLAIAMWSEYKYEIDLMKVITMISVHEIEEIVIGDLTCFEIEKEEKRRIGKEAVQKVFSNLMDASEIIKLIDEFENKETNEAKFAYYCDKLECDIQSKLYDEQNCVDIKNIDNYEIKVDKDVKEMIDKGFSFSKMWQTFGLKKYNYDKNFTAVSQYVMNNKIFK